MATTLASEMTRPQPRCFIPGTSRVISRTIEPTFWLYTLVQSAAVDSSQGVSGYAPALLTRMSAPPKASFTTLATASAPASELKSPIATTALPPADVISAATRSALVLAPSVDDDCHPFGRQRFGNCLADATAAAGNEGSFSLKLQVHWQSPSKLSYNATGDHAIDKQEISCTWPRCKHDPCTLRRA